MTKARDLANGATALSAVSATELAYLDGVTSAVQTQIDGKQAVNANVSTTELGYLDGVTSAIQTQVDAKIAKTLTTTTGDIIYASGANTPARLGIGSTSNVLTVAGGIPSWAAPASGGMTVLASGSLSGAAVTISTINQTYNDLVLDISGAVWSANANVGIRVNGLTTNYSYVYYANSGDTAGNQAEGAGALPTYWIAGDAGALPSAADTFKRYRFTFPMYALTTGTIQMFGFYTWGNENSTISNGIIIGSHATADNIDEITFKTNASQTFSAGTYTLYGVK